MSAVAIMTPIVVGLALWWASERLARAVVGPVGDNQVLNTAIISDESYRIIIAMTGALIFAIKLPDIVQIILRGMATKHITEKVGDFYFYELSAQLASIGIGVWLFFGNAFWLGCIRKFREFGLEKTDI